MAEYGISVICQIPTKRTILHCGRNNYFRFSPIVCPQIFSLAGRLGLINLAGDSGAIINGYQTDTAQLPYYYYAIFDPTREFEQSLECGLIALHEMPAIGSNSFLLTPSFYNDTILKVLPRNTTNPDCYNLSRSYYEYDVKLSSTGISNYSACDKNHTSTGTCISQAMIRYSTFDLQTFKIVQGMSATDILTDEGGIIGGIAFLFWIFTIWTQWRS